MLVVRLLCLVFGIVHLTFFSLAQAPATGSIVNPSGKSSEAPALRVKTNIVNLAVSVLDRRGGNVTALDASHFEIYEDGIKQQIEHFTTNDEPLSIGIILDTSGSMSVQLERVRGWLKSFLQESHADDEFFLFAVHDRPQLLKDFADGNALLENLSGLEAKGNTALYDGIAAGLEKLKQGRHAKRALLVLSDGEDNQSRIRYRQLMQQAKESDVQIYSVGYANASNTSCGRICQMQAKAALDDLTAVTGGESVFILTRSELEQTLTSIALQLRQQYSLGYLSTNESDAGKWRKLEIKVRNGEAKNKFVVRTRKGYFPGAYK